MTSAILIITAFIIAIGLLTSRVLKGEREATARLRKSMRTAVDRELATGQPPRQRLILNRAS